MLGTILKISSKMPPAIVPGPTNGTDAKSGPSKLTANQEMLDENSSLIKTISEFQNLGKHHEAMTYQVLNSS